MASDPLALLGDAFSNFGANYAARHFQNQREDKLRQQQLDDQARARQFQLDDRTHAETRADALRTADQEREVELYNTRKYDAIRAQLIKDRLLDPQDDSIEAFSAALKKRGPDYERNLTELAQLKAHAIQLIEQTKGDATELNKIFTLGPEQIDVARNLMSTAATQLSIKLQGDEVRKLENQEAGGAALSAANNAIVASNQRLADLGNEYERITSGALTPDEAAQVKRQALAAPELAGLKETDLLKPSNQAIVAAAIAKAEQNFRALRGMQIQAEAKSATAQQRNAAVQLEAITAAARSGLPIKFNSPAALTGDTVPAPAAKTNVATDADRQAALAALVGKKPAASGSASPAALTGDTGGQSPITSVRGLVQRIPDPVTLLATPGNIIDQAGRYGGALVGGLYDGNFSVPEKGLVTRAGEAIGSALTGDIYAKDNTSPDERAMEDEVLARAPYSLRAVEIRKKRGLPPLAPAIPGTTPAVLQ